MTITRIITLPVKQVAIILLLIIIFHSCSLNPLAWTPPIKPEITGVLEENELLSKTEKIKIEENYGPEDVAIDSKGNLYCGTHVSKNNFMNGKVLKIDTTGKVTTYCDTKSWVLGMHFDKNENLIACDLKRGLISIDKQGEINILATKDENGNPFYIPNDIDIASDGMIYFSNTTSRVENGKKSISKILLEVRPDGGLYRYNPETKKVKTLIDSSFCGNGVAVSQNDEFVLMVDLTKYRVLRHWLKGNQKGETEVFIENLSGIPNGISRGKDGNFWLGFSTKRDDLLDKIQPKKGVKKFLFSIPTWLQPKKKPYGMVMKLSEEGEILKTYYDTSGKHVSETSSVQEYNGYLYFGGDLTNYIGKYKLEEY